jgi:hypothetical protein
MKEVKNNGKPEEFARSRHCRLMELTSGMHRKKMGFHEFYSKLGYNNTQHEKQYLRKVL